MSPPMPRVGAGMLQLPRGSPVGALAALSPRPAAPPRPSPAAMWGWSRGSPGPARWDRARLDAARPGMPWAPQTRARHPPVPPAAVTSGGAGGPCGPAPFASPLPEPPPGCGLGGSLFGFAPAPGCGGVPLTRPLMAVIPAPARVGSGRGLCPPAVAGDGGGGDTSAALMEPVRSLPSPRPLCGSAAAAGRAPWPPVAPLCFPCPPGHPVPLPEAPSPPSCRGSSRGAADAELPKSRF